ncbi:MAG: Lipoprotein-releasing system ATP-binding protein LolD [Pseudomonadota bacterium]
MTAQDEVLRLDRVEKVVQEATGPLCILREVSLTIRKGETVAVVGASGSGKSTLLSIMAGLDTPSAGQVWALGQSLSTMGEDERAGFRARHMGFVFQSFQLLGHLTALENVALPLELLGADHVLERAQVLLKEVGLAERMHAYPRVLSGGEQQRVALARAFVVQPSLLLADEPTGSLDTETGQRVLELMLDMNQQHGTTLVLVTHDPQLANRCDRRIVVQSGQVLGG